MNREKVKKQIEEMAKVMCGNDCEECARESAEFYKQTLEEARNNKCLLKNCAKTLYEQGYRKLPEDSVTIRKCEYDALKAIEKYHIKSCGKDIIVLSKEEYNEIKTYQSYVTEIKKAFDMVSMTTAEKILDVLYCTPKEQVESKIKEIAKQFNVKI